jgi:hypothetical protein
MKKDLLKTYNYVQSLYQKGNTNNEELSKLLAMLKEISDARPTEIVEDFKSLFNDLDLTDDTLNHSATMFMMFLTKLAVSYKPTNSSEFPNKLGEIIIGNEALLDQVKKISEESLSKFHQIKPNDNYKELAESHFYFVNSVLSILLSQRLYKQQKIQEWLNEIGY